MSCAKVLRPMLSWSSHVTLIELTISWAAQTRLQSKQTAERNNERNLGGRCSTISPDMRRNVLCCVGRPWSDAHPAVALQGDSFRRVDQARPSVPARSDQSDVAICQWASKTTGTIFITTYYIISVQCRLFYVLWLVIITVYNTGCPKSSFPLNLWRNKNK